MYEIVFTSKLITTFVLNLTELKRSITKQVGEVMKLKALFSLGVALLTAFCGVDAQGKYPKNVIFMIGDGMGVNQVQAALVKNGVLQMQTMPVGGFNTTYSANKFITDSGAGGTALACGTKTNNYSIGVNPDSLPVPSIIALAEGKGMATGIVTTCNLTHATPAAFYAHVASRNSTEDIALFFPKSGVDIAIGGGRNDFEKRKDGKNLSNELIQNGYSVIYTPDSLTYFSGKKCIALLADDHPKKQSEGREYLSQAVAFAAQSLSKQSKKGFFLMVEGSQIDWGGHANDLDYIVNEAIDFDKAVGAALEFARKDGNTLVVVTADHETGMSSVYSGSVQNKEISLNFDSTNHSGALVPVFAFGPGAELFGGLFDNTAHFVKFKTLLKIK